MGLGIGQGEGEGEGLRQEFTPYYRSGRVQREKYHKGRDRSTEWRASLLCFQEKRLEATPGG